MVSIGVYARIARKILRRILCSIYCCNVDAGNAISTPTRLYHCEGETFGAQLSHAGEIAVIATAENTRTLNYSLVAIDPSNGKVIWRLSDGEESSIEIVEFSPLNGDMRLLATTNRTGFKRPVLWNPRTGERTDLTLDELQGDVVPEAWSPDGSRILLCQFPEVIGNLKQASLLNAVLRFL